MWHRETEDNMKATVTFEKEIKELPENCTRCPFVDICASAIPSITKRGGMEFTAAAIRGRVKGCPLKFEQ